MPDWMQSISRFNPISYAVDAVRVLTINGFTTGTVASAFVVIGFIAVVTMAATLYQFRKVIS
jgi:ABC-type multidrug transport system permease subunit